MAISITSPLSAAQLVAALVGTGISNVSGETYTGFSGAAGTFSGGLSVGFPFDSGVCLTTGSAPLVPMIVSGTHNPNHCPNVGIPGPNDCSNAGQDNAQPGSAILAALITTTAGNTHDAAILSFTFTPIGDTITMQYVFGSEEYKEFVGSRFNDVFGVFLNGTDVSNNVAVLPGTSTPVAINSVNQNVNSQYFTFGGINCQYDGYVGLAVGFPLTITAAVNAGVPNTLLIGICDVADAYFDSGLMFQFQSLSSSGGGGGGGRVPVGCLSPTTLTNNSPNGCVQS